jgi:hypothetical protein
MTAPLALPDKARMVADCVLNMEACFGLALVFGRKQTSIPKPISRVYSIIHTWFLVLSNSGPAPKLAGNATVANHLANQYTCTNWPSGWQL